MGGGVSVLLSVRHVETTVASSERGLWGLLTNMCTSKLYKKKKKSTDTHTKCPHAFKC